MIRRKLAILFVAAMMIFSIMLPNLSSAANDDITGITLEKEMRDMIAKGVMEGYGNGIYKPSLEVSRGQFATFLSRALNLHSDEPVSFSDVSPSSKLAIGIQNAYAAGLIDGYGDGTFRPNELITREQMSVMIYRAVQYLQMNGEASIQSITELGDYLEISPKFRESVDYNMKHEIIKGYNIDGKVYFKPKDVASRAQAAAVISRMLILVEKGTDPVPTDPEPSLKYQIANVNGSELQFVKGYASYDQALANWNRSTNQVITYGNKIIKMSSGMAVSIPTLQSSLTYIYESGMKTAETYVTSGTEFKYIESDEEKVKIQIGDRIGYVKHENVNLIPAGLSKSTQSYYLVQGGELFHYLYNYSTNRYNASYVIGKAPAFLQPNVKYYSWDGHTFYDANGRQVGKDGYQYFQHLPARTETKYTAEELNTFIHNRLQELEQLANSNPNVYGKYANATKKSKVIGLGTHLKKVEKERKVNALMILSLAFHESDYGMSARALEYNNLFGLYVYDTNPLKKKFASVEANVDELLNAFWDKNYIPPNAAYGNGAIFGNKGIGFNVKYASDAYWGAKAAGHMYRIDKALGGKELKNPYRIGKTNIEGLNFRTTPEVKDNKAFTYNKKGMPVVILEEVKRPDRIWIKTRSDHANYSHVFVAGEYVNELNIVK